MSTAHEAPDWYELAAFLACWALLLTLGWLAFTGDPRPAFVAGGFAALVLSLEFWPGLLR